MNDEIKEIIDEFLKEKSAYSLRYSFNGDLAYSQEQILKDYITNLQEENERLKEELKNRPIVDFTFDTYKELEDYKSRCEKAIKYIEQEAVFYDSYDGEDTMLEELCERYYKELLNILNGGDE